MYDWSRVSLVRWRMRYAVSVVIERMYDWSSNRCQYGFNLTHCFSCYWKNVRLKRYCQCICKAGYVCFSCYWKNVRLKHVPDNRKLRCHRVSVVIERMYDWSRRHSITLCIHYQFQLLLKECTIEARRHCGFRFWCPVSVVIERMYDWSSETNWLKINDFWQLVSGLFFENGRSAQKVPLFSKIWGDCLTVFDSCGNI